MEGIDLSGVKYADVIVAHCAGGCESICVVASVADGLVVTDVVNGTYQLAFPIEGGPSLADGEDRVGGAVAVFAGPFPQKVMDDVRRVQATLARWSNGRRDIQKIFTEIGGNQMVAAALACANAAAEQAPAPGPRR